MDDRTNCTLMLPDRFVQVLRFWKASDRPKRGLTAPAASLDWNRNVEKRFTSR
jgi:hypothetical protein